MSTEKGCQEKRINELMQLSVRLQQGMLNDTLLHIIIKCCRTLYGNLHDVRAGRCCSLGMLHSLPSTGLLLNLMEINWSAPEFLLDVRFRYFFSLFFLIPKNVLFTFGYLTSPDSAMPSPKTVF
jgi:hypothetical protein